jgi:hypothetical protein
LQSTQHAVGMEPFMEPPGRKRRYLGSLCGQGAAVSTPMPELLPVTTARLP